MNDPRGTMFVIGQRVRVSNPDGFVSYFANRVRNRIGIVEDVFTPLGKYSRPRVKVRFLKRGNRGKEFIETMSESFLEHSD